MTLSPNALWALLGYTVARSGPTGQRRRVYDADGVLVCDNAGHDEETRIAETLLRKAEEANRK